MPSKAELAMISLTDVFYLYSSRDGDPQYLNKNELRALFNKEFPSFVAECKDPAALEQFMTELDINSDGKVDFNEFAIMITTLSIICNGIREHKREVQQL